jgi:hypothetical protein
MPLAQTPLTVKWQAKIVKTLHQEGPHPQKFVFGATNGTVIGKETFGKYVDDLIERGFVQRNTDNILSLTEASLAKLEA